MMIKDLEEAYNIGYSDGLYETKILTTNTKINYFIVGFLLTLLIDIGCNYLFK